MRVTRRACNPNLQVVITHASHVCCQHSFGLPLRMNGMHRMQFDHVRLDFLSLIIWLRVFRLSVTWHFCKGQWWSKGLTFDCCCLHNFGNLWLFLLISNYIFKGGPIRKPYRLPWAPLPFFLKNLCIYLTYMAKTDKTENFQSEHILL